MIRKRFEFAVWLPWKWKLQRNVSKLRKHVIFGPVSKDARFEVRDALERFYFVPTGTETFPNLNWPWTKVFLRRAHNKKSFLLNNTTRACIKQHVQRLSSDFGNTYEDNRIVWLHKRVKNFSIWKIRLIWKIKSKISHSLFFTMFIYFEIRLLYCISWPEPDLKDQTKKSGQAGFPVHLYSKSSHFWEVVEDINCILQQKGNQFSQAGAIIK